MNEEEYQKEIQRYKDGVKALYSYIDDEELESKRRLGVNPDYYQAVLTTTSKIKDLMKNTFTI